MRVEYVDMSELIRRIEEKIYDQEEFEKAIQWVRNNCKENDLSNAAVLEILLKLHYVQVLLRDNLMLQAF